MKVALYGEKKELLQKYKEKMEQAFGSTNEMIEIDCFSNKSNVRQQSLSYDVIILSEEFMKEMIMYANGHKGQTLTLTAGKHIETFDTDEILYIEAELKTVHVGTVEGEKIIKFPISEVEKLLDDEIFIKTHRSYIVNRHQIKTLMDNEAVLKNGKRIPISKYRWKDVRRKYLGENEKEDCKDKNYKKEDIEENNLIENREDDKNESL
ncbi:MAG: LytTR family transcriptional regulator [Lachnospiraceae bacterium]|nr:LytTR family transcriptional regulator [Lachnospiraceae bacterium]